ncbi:hypothetical protein FD733_15270 [Pantoea sp. Eser]|nr:hypothetical protein [Pantoea sp. Eser]
MLLAVFLNAVGFEKVLNFSPRWDALRLTLREIALALILVVTSLATLLVMARMFSLNKGIAAGIAAAAVTQSAIIGTVSAAIAKLNHDPHPVTANAGKGRRRLRRDVHFWFARRHHHLCHWI